MSNPATKLLELLRSWDVAANQTPEQARGFNEGTETFWQQHIRAVGYLRDITVLLDGVEASGRRVEPYRRAMPNWTAAVFAFNTPWRQSPNSPRRCIAEADLDVLEALETLIDEANLAPETSEAERNRLHEAVKDAQKLVLGDKELPQDLRRYLLGLISEADYCLTEYNSFGSVELRGISFQLGGALLTAASSAGSDERRNKFSELASKFLIPATNTAIAAGSLYLQIGKA